MLDPLADQVRSAPDAPAILDGDRMWTYQQLDREADRLAYKLAGAGIGRGSVVATLLHVSPTSIALVHAVPRTGATLAPLHPRWAERELIAYLQLLRPSLVVCEEATERLAKVAVTAAPLANLDPPSSRRAIHLDLMHASDAELPGLAAGATHSLVATSGTSGRPRAARLTLEGHLAVARASVPRLQLRPSDVWLGSLELAHIGGLALVLRAAFVGSAVRVASGFDATGFNNALDAGRFTSASLVPTMLRNVVDDRAGRAAPDTARLVLVGGAHCPRKLVEEALALELPIALTYGQTEAHSQVATASPEEVRADPTSVGRPLDGVRVKRGRGGELLVDGPTIFEGYLGEERAPFTEDGWLRTGDTARIDADGGIRLTGRLSARIVTGGVNVDPAAVEAVLLEHPGVRHAAVVGVEDAHWGERVVAVVERKREAELEGAAVLAFVKGELSGPNRPKEVHVWDELPLSPNGKVDRRAVRERLYEP